MVVVVGVEVRGGMETAVGAFIGAAAVAVAMVAVAVAMVAVAVVAGAAAVVVRVMVGVVGVAVELGIFRFSPYLKMAFFRCLRNNSAFWHSFSVVNGNEKKEREIQLKEMLETTTFKKNISGHPTSTDVLKYPQIFSDIFLIFPDILMYLRHSLDIHTPVKQKSNSPA